MKIGIAGTGRMGTAIALRLLELGHEITVWNRASSFDIDFMRKDLRDMLQEAKALGISLPVAARTLKCFDEASRAEFGKIDATQYPAWWVSHTETEQA